MAIRSTPISVLTLQPKTKFSRKNSAPYNQETMVMTLSLLEVINVGLSNFSLQYQHNIKQVWAVRGIRRRTKVCLFKTLVLPVLICGCETRKITKANERKLNSFQCQCLRWIRGSTISTQYQAGVGSQRNKKENQGMPVQDFSPTGPDMWL